jgi:hypothetical protein
MVVFKAFNPLLEQHEVAFAILCIKKDILVIISSEGNVMYCIVVVYKSLA